MDITVIAAVTDNLALGRGGDMLYHISADLRRFKRVTMGKPLIMGRKTFESLPGALPGRRNMVVTRNAEYQAPGIETFPSLEAALAACAEYPEVCIIGGGQIYAQAMPLATRLVLTQIHVTADHADTFFPAWSWEDWAAIPADECPEQDHNPSSLMEDARTGVMFNYLTLKRRRKVVRGN